MHTYLTARLQVIGARWGDAAAAVKSIHRVPVCRPGESPEEARAREERGVRKEAALQAALRGLGASITVDVLAASIDNENRTGSFSLSIVMPEMLPLPPLESLSLEQRLQIVRDVAETVATLHSLPDGWGGGAVLHRDIKPDNILLDKPLGEGGRAHLGDFGLALWQAGTTAVGGVTHQGPQGTPRYMHASLWQPTALPNKVRLTNTLSAPTHKHSICCLQTTDVYSLAITAWEVLTGRSPFEAELRAGVPGPVGAITGIPAAGAAAAAGAEPTREQWQRVTSACRPDLFALPPGVPLLLGGVGGRRAGQHRICRGHCCGGICDTSDARCGA